MTVVNVPTPAAEAASATGETSRENGIRAAEAAGHRRALASEAHGRIDVPELGRIEVRAVAEASKVEVHVHADETHAKQVIFAHAPELSAHVHREVPEARVHVERPLHHHGQQTFTTNDGASRDLGRNQGEDRRGGRHEQPSPGGRSAVGGAEDLTISRSRARVRIVL